MRENCISKLGLLILLVIFPMFVLAQNKPKRDRTKDNIGVKKERAQKKNTSSKKITANSSYNKSRLAQRGAAKKETEKQYFYVSKDFIEVSERGGVYDISVSSSSSWKIDLGTSHWTQLTRKGDNLHLEIAENAQESSRTDYFMLSSGENRIKIHIKQKGHQREVSRLDLSSYTHDFSSDRSSYEIIVSSNSNWNISVTTASWAHISRNSNKLILTVDENTSSQGRNDYFCVQSGDIVKRFTLTQQGKTSNNTYSSANRGVTMNSYSSTTNINAKNNQYASYYIDKNDWWKDRIRLGWNILGYEMNSDILAIKTGLKLRFGKHSDAFNLILGCDYTYHAVYASAYGDSWWSVSDFDYYTILHQLSFNATIRFNLFKVGVSKFYIGNEFETGIKLADGKYSVENKNWPIATAPQIGFNCKHFDFGLYYKKFIDNYNLFHSFEDYKIGGFAVWYF